MGSSSSSTSKSNILQRLESDTKELTHTLHITHDALVILYKDFIGNETELMAHLDYILGRLDHLIRMIQHQGQLPTVLTEERIGIMCCHLLRFRDPLMQRLIVDSVWYLIQHPEAVQCINTYTGSAYTEINGYLDIYLNPNVPMSDVDVLPPNPCALDLIQVFKDPNAPVLGKSQYLRRCVIHNAKYKEKFNRINYRVTSVTMDDAATICPESQGIERIRVDQILRFDGSVKGLYIGFLSQFPHEVEVLLQPGTSFTQLKPSELPEEERTLLETYKHKTPKHVHLFQVSPGVIREIGGFAFK